MQIDMNLIPQFEGAMSDGVGAAFATGPGGFGVPEFLFFLATYVWEMTGGENTSTALDVLF